MIVKSIQTGLIAGSALLASFGLVQAQEATTTSTPEDVIPEASEVNPTDDDAGDSDTAAADGQSLTAPTTQENSATAAGDSAAGDSGSGPVAPSGMVQAGQAQLDRMEATADNIAQMLRAAREDNDIVKALCLDDKLNQINVAARTAGDRQASLEAAAASGNEERVRTDYQVLEALAVRGNELASEANLCIGAENGQLGGTLLKVEIDPSVPNGDSTNTPPNVVISAPPVAASPTL